MALLCPAFILSVATAAPTYAAGIVVDDLGDGPPANDGNCTLREAIINANNDDQSGSTDCAAGSGADTITFSVSGTITLGSTLPNISDASGLTIDGSGQSVTVSGNNAHRVLVVNGGKPLSLNAITIANGLAGGFTIHAGGIFNSGVLIVTNSTFVGNRAPSGSGGAIENHEGTLTVVNSTFSGNSGFGTGGILNNAGALTVVNSTIAGNSAAVSGVGAGLDNFGATATLKNTIIANNSPSPNCRNFSGSFTADSHNLATDGSCASATVKTSAQINLGPLAPNGGPTRTMALQSGSAAIDAGDNAVCAAAPVNNLDQRGEPRPVDGDGNGSAICDTGAYEAPEGTTPPADTIAPTAGPAVSSGTPGSNGWYVTDVTVSWNWSDDEGGSGIDRANCTESSMSSGEGSIELTAPCRDNAGNTAEASYTVQVDQTPPTLSPAVSPNPVVLNGSATAIANANDATSGVASESCGAVDTSSVGSKTVTCTATDNAGNSASATASYSVVYDFSGFFSPVDNPPALNEAKAGSAVPVNFSLGGDQGLDIFADGYPKSVGIDCPISDEVDPVEETITAGSSGLSYDPATDTYTYVWKTKKDWARTCRQLIVRLDDGSEHVADFQFSR